MKGLLHIIQVLAATATRLRRDESGVALVEFAIALPLVLVLFATTIEGGRLFWAYQATNAGVRDAARYLARVADKDVCATGSDLDSYTDKLEDIVRESSSGNALFPSGISVTEVEPSLNCVDGTYRLSPAPVAEVTATLQVTFPFANVFTLVGLGALSTVTTTITDQSRIYGT